MEAVSEDVVVCEIRCRSTYCHHGDPVNQEHHCRKDRKSEPAVGDYAVDFIRSGGHSLLFLFVAGPDDLGDVQIALVGDDAFSVIVQLFFCVPDVVFDVGKLFG